MQLVSQEFFDVGSDGMPGVVSISRTMSVEAYKSYLKGRFHLRKRTAESCRLALAFFTHAVEIDPEYAIAVSGIAETHLALWALGAETIDEACPLAKKAARRALDLDPTIGDAYVSIGTCLGHFEFDRPAAERAYRRALKFDPSNSAAYLRLGADTLLSQRRFSEAVSNLSAANSLDPLWAETGIGLGRALSYSGKFREAVKCLKSVLKFEPLSAEAVIEIGTVYARMGKFDDAIDVMNRFSEHDGQPNMRLRVAYFLAGSGRTDEAREIVDKISGNGGSLRVSQYDLALALIGIGETGAAFDALEREIDNFGYAAHFYAIAPELDPVRADARFRNLLARMNLLDV